MEQELKLNQRTLIQEDIGKLNFLLHVTQKINIFFIFIKKFHRTIFIGEILLIFNFTKLVYY